MTAALVTSADGQWAAIRVGAVATLLDYPGKGEPGRAPMTAIELPSDEVDLALFAPAGLIAVVRTPRPRVTLYSVPELEATAAIELEAPMHIVAATGPRLILGNRSKTYVIVRAAPRALAAQAIEPGVADFVAGMDKNQVLFGVPKKLEVWDAVSARPMLRLQLQLPPPPRAVGSALGHLFVTRPGSDEVYVYRLSDGRPFRQHAGAPVERAISHPASPIVVFVTSRGLVRMNCLAHSLTMLDTPYTPGDALAIHGTGDAVTLLGATADGEAWRVPLDAPVTTAPGSPPPATVETVTVPTVPTLQPSVPPSRPSVPVMDRTTTMPGGALAWRTPLAAAARQLARGESAELPIAEDTELADLTRRLALRAPGRRALTALYALYLIGEQPSIAQLAELVDDWREPLGRGELGALAMLGRSREGRISLRRSVSNLLDGAAPRAIQIIGSTRTGTRHGVFKLVRGGRTDLVIIEALIGELGKLAVIEGKASTALLEARLHDAVAVALVAPTERPAPWPVGVDLVIVVDETSPRWVSEAGLHPIAAFDAP